MSIDTAIYTIRHAHTHYNAEKRYAGTIDIPLNDVGIQSAQEAATKLHGFQFDVVVTSTMKRSIETARILVGNTAPMVQSELCNERNFGILEGLTWDDVQHVDPPILLINVGNDLHTVNPRGGEPFEDLWERAKKFRKYLFEYYAGKNILVVSHGVFLQMFHGVLRGSNCIELLAAYPSNLVLYQFLFQDHRLVDEWFTKLAQANGAHF